MTRQREQYWLGIYIDKLIRAKATFDCLVFGQIDSSEDLGGAWRAAHEGPGGMYEALIIQLGTFMRYQMYSNQNHSTGDVLKCTLFRRRTGSPGGAMAPNNNPRAYLLLPVTTPLTTLPPSLAAVVFNPEVKERTLLIEETETEADPEDRNVVQ